MLQSMELQRVGHNLASEQQSIIKTTFFLLLFTFYKWLLNNLQLLGLPKSSFEFCHMILQKNPNKLFGQPNIYRMWLPFFFLLDSALTEEETEGQRGKMTCARLQSNTEPQRQSSNQVSRLASWTNAPIPT